MGGQPERCNDVRCKHAAGSVGGRTSPRELRRDSATQAGSEDCTARKQSESVSIEVYYPVSLSVLETRLGDRDGGKRPQARLS